MSDQDLRDLLHDQVADVTTTDLAAEAWPRAVRRRRRRAAAVVGGTALAVVLVTGGIAALTRGPDRVEPTPQVPTPQVPTPREPTPSAAATPAPPAGPDATYGELPVWWSPGLDQEQELPWIDASPLPREIDLGPAAPAATDLEVARAVFAVYDNGELRRMVALAPDGSSRLLDVPRLEPVSDEDGNGAALLPREGGLSPDGRHVFFAQNSSIELYDFAAGSWLTIDTADWVAEGARWTDDGVIWVPDELGGPDGTTYDVEGRPLGAAPVDREPALDGGEEYYGPTKVVGGAIAQTYRLDGSVEPVPAGGGYSNPEAVVVRQGARARVLALAGFERSKGCCAVAGLLDEDTVVFESAGRLLAWRVGTHDLRRVAELTGTIPGREGYVASFADLAAD